MRKKSGVAFLLLGAIVLFSACVSTGPSYDEQKEEPKNEESVEVSTTTMVYEAEAAEMTGAVVDTKHAGFTGEGFVDFKPNAPGGTLKWLVEASEDGEYVMQFRYAHKEGNRPLKIEINGEQVASEMKFMGTGDWTNWQTLDLPVSLKAGMNEVLVTAVGVEGGGNIDHMKLLKQFSALYEAEDGISTATAVDTKHAGFTGEGFVDFKPNAPGGTIEWEAEVPSDGLYTLMFRYAHKEGNRPLQVAVNGKVVVEQLDFMGTGDWAAWDVVETAVMLKGGKNKILVTATGVEGGGNIDHLKIVMGATEDQEKIEFQVIAMEELLSADMIAALESRGLLQIAGKNNKMKFSGSPEIMDAYALSDELIYVRIDSGFLSYEPYDLIIAAAKGNWDSLDPQLTYVPTKSVAVGADPDGNTVVIYKLDAPYADTAEPTPLQFNADISKGLELARNLISWQLDNGGWTKNRDADFKRRWNGTEEKAEFFSVAGEELGTIDNDATIKELRYIAQIYRETNQQDLKDSINKGIDFLLNMQYPSGAFPQMYPQRDVPGGSAYYANYGTYNDDAMINVLRFFDDIMAKQYPFDVDVVSREKLAAIKNSRNLAIDFILKSQIRVNGQLTAWCAQHDPQTYEPMPARSYEHASISGKESVSIVKYLLGLQNKTPAIQEAIDAALDWFDKVKLEGISYVPSDSKGDFFVDDPNGVTWYRFYDIKTFEPIFSGRDGIIKRSIKEIEEERQNGYTWAGPFAQQLLVTMKKTGYFPGKVFAQVVDEKSSSMFGSKTMILGSVMEVEELNIK